MKKLGINEELFDYLRSGELTNPFSDSAQLDDTIRDIVKLNKGIDGKNNTLTGLVTLIHNEVKNRVGANKNNPKRFSRTAEEAYNSMEAIDVNDYAMIFASLARQLRIPTTCLYAIERNDLKNKFEGDRNDEVLTKSFCECYFDNEWVIVDPEKGYIKENYNPELFTIGKGQNKKEYVGYKRALDLGKKRSLNSMRDYEKEQSRTSYFKTRNMTNQEEEQVL